MKWHMPYEGTTYVFDDERVTAHEARVMKRVTEGMSPVQIAAKRLEGDPDVWVAMLVVARERAGLESLQAVQVDDRKFYIEDALDATTTAMKTARTETETPAESGEGEPKAPRRARRPKSADAPVEEPSAA